MIDALLVKPVEGGLPEIIRTKLEADSEPGGEPEPSYDALKEHTRPTEHVEVAPGIHVWCDEEFRLKSLEPSAFIRAIPRIDRLDTTPRVWDFGGPLVITGPSREALLVWAADNLSLPVPGGGAKLHPGGITVSRVNDDGSLTEVASFDNEEPSAAKREAKRIGALMDKVGPAPKGDR